MPQAMLIAGNSQRFSEEIEQLRSYLIEDVGIGTKSVRVFRTAYLCEGMLRYRLEMAIQKKTKDPLLVAYCGHGSDSGWDLDDTRTFSYGIHALFLTRNRRPVVLVNDCCHAMSAAQTFRFMGVKPERVSLIAASEPEETAVQCLIPLLVNSWRQRRPVRFGPELRWGACLDHLFFPKQPAP